MKVNDHIIVIGLGKIGYRGFPQTHYQCAIRNKLKVVAGIDASPEARNRFTTETGIPAYDSLANLPEENWGSFFTVASSNDVSFEILKGLLSKKGPRGILAEKPFCKNASESKEILSLQAHQQTPLRINFPRQYAHAMSTIKTLVAKRKLISGVVIYSSGLRENGSHFIRLICGLFPMVDFSKNIVWTDSETFKLQVSKGITIDFIPLESPHLHSSEIKLVFEEIIMTISEGLKIDIRKIDRNSQIRNWPRDLELFFTADFSDGFESSYLDQSWWRSKNQELISEELRLDHLCNVLLETAPTLNKLDVKEIQNDS